LNDILYAVIQVYIYIVLASIILSYFQVPYDHPVASIHRGARRLVDPVLDLIRRVVRPLPIGGALLDLSPIVLIVGLSFFRSLFR
jgi:uncharacterized protein YggT (Ycf19 family)